MKTRHSARRLISACTLSAAAVIALAAPGAASAEIGKPCSGVNVTGQGASVLSLAFHEVWIPGFNTSEDKYACNGAQGEKGTPKVTYTNTGSGAGLESWGVNKHAAVYSASNALVGTSEAPNAGQIGEIEANETKPTSSTVETIPVVQFATAIIVNLPKGCTATSPSNKGRLVLTQATLESIWRGTINTWQQIDEAEVGHGGDTVAGTGCVTTTPINRIVRVDSSGPADFLKKYLGLINGATFENEKGETETWTQSSEGKQNTVWPKAAAVKHTAAKGETEEDKLVDTTESSIGFGNLAEIRANQFFDPAGGGGPKTARFWAPIQNNSAANIFADPATDKDATKLGSANCSKEEYTNGVTAFPPASVLAPWNEVTTSTSEPKYGICGLAYVLALKSYGAYESGTGTSLGEATTVENFLRFVVDAGKGGQGALIKNHDYLALTGTVLKEAQKGAALTAF
jgi:ABC-type phosphate transport system substrate-binding protein